MHVFWFVTLWLWFDLSQSMAHFNGFNLQSVSGLNFLSLVCVFNFSVAVFLLPPIDLICSQARILTV